MDEAIHIVLGDSLGDALSTVNVNIIVGEIPGTLSIYDHHLQEPAFALTLWGVRDRQGCKRRRSDGHSLRWTECCADPIPKGNQHGSGFLVSVRGLELRTRKVTRPRSPVTFR